MSANSYQSVSKSIAFILVFFMLFNVVGLSVAQARTSIPNQATKKKDITPNIGELPDQPPESRKELKSKRTRYSTRYINPDGSFTEEIYLKPKFYKDSEDNKWKKINNNLEVSAKKKDRLKNTANGFQATFAQSSGQTGIAAIEKNGKRVSFVPIGAKKVTGTVKNNKITYQNIYNNTDIRYQAQGAGIKEDIILNQYTGQNTFTFELKLQGLEAKQEDNGMIYLVNQQGEKLWYFEKPYMVDANGKHSTKVELKLRKEAGKVYIDVVADKGFLEDSATKYPVTIDPTINNWNVMRDSFVASSFPDSSYSSLNDMYTGNDAYYYGKMRSLVKFFLPSLPSDSKISNASFSVYQTYDSMTNHSIDLYRVTSDWTDSVTWNTQPTIAANPESTVTDNSYNQYWQWDITDLMIDWYNSEQANYGFMLKQQDETGVFRRFNTVDSGSNTPKISIDYTVDPIGQEEFWGYTKDGVNPANGNLVLQEKDFAIPGRGIPINLKRTYNSRKSSIAGIFGYGWTTNLEAQLVDAGAGPITLIDGDNTRHIFGQKVGGGYEAAGGIYLTLDKHADGTYTVTKADGTKLNFTTSGKISSIVDPNGNTTTLTYQNGDLTSVQDPSGRTADFNYGTNGLVSSIDLPGSRTISYEYDPAGNLTTVIDAEGNAVNLDYDSNHNLTAITDQRSNTTTINYDGSGRVDDISSPITIDGVTETSTTDYVYDETNSITSVTDGEGRRIDYQYNPNGNIVQTTKNPLDANQKAVTTFAYDNNNNLVEMKDANTNQVEGTSAYVYTYDDNGNITQVQLPEGQTGEFAYDSNNNLTQKTDFKGQESSYDYDQNNNQLESIAPNLQATASRYSSEGNVKYKTKSISAANNLVANSNFENDSNGDSWADNWTTATESGTTANFAWSDTAKLGSKSVSISDPTGWAIVSSEMIPYQTGDEYTVSGYVKTVNTTNSVTIKLEFFDDQDNWLDQEISYGLQGTHDWTRVNTIIDQVPTGTAKVRVSVGLNAGSGTAYFDGIQLEKGTVVSAYNLVENAGFERDSDSNELPDSWTVSSNLAANDGLDSNNSYSGQNSFKLTGEAGTDKYLKQRINISGDSTTNLTLSGWSKQVAADPNGGNYNLQVAINYSDGTVDWSNANAFNKTKAGWQHIAAEINPMKSFDSIDVYYCYYDQPGTAWFDAMRLEKNASFTSYTYDSGKNYVTSVEDPAGNTVDYSYDPYGNKTSQTDGQGNTTAYQYDNRNLLTKVTDAKQNETLYGYDGAGNRTTVTDAKNNQTTYDYNEFNKVSSFTNPLDQVTEFEYDKNGNKTDIIFPNGNQVSYGYNALNRLDSIDYNGSQQWSLAYDRNGNLTSVTDSDTGKTTTYTYDQNNQLLKQEEGSTNSLEYSYDNNGQPTALTITAGSTTATHGQDYNPLGQLVGLTRNSSTIEEFAYDEEGNLTTIIRSNGTYTSLEYNGANQLTAIRNYDANGGLLDKYEYTYDANGNRTSVTTTDGTISYQYDKLNRLVQETLLDGTTISYEYDATGNRTKKIVDDGTVTTTDYSYDAANQLTAVDGQAYSYDQNGNLTANGENSFVYNAKNRLIEVKDSSDQTIASFTYNHKGKRKSKTTASGTVYYHYNKQGKLVYETDENNNIVREYTYDAQGNPATMTHNGETYYYHVNGHGDVMSLTDSSGAVVAEYEYDAWGNIISQSGTMAAENPHRYAGYYYDESTELYYLNARYYNAEIGRFITRDTFQGFEDNPQSLNKYAYCQGNPVMNVDPSGYFGLSVATYFIGKAIFYGTLGYGSYLIGRYGWWNAHRYFSFNDWAWSVASAAVFNLPVPIIQTAGSIFFQDSLIYKAIYGITWGSAMAAATWIARKIYR
ncbi:RHS repeat-associated core domain protein [Halobacteroides halobius DSM 5150]|uniref:RHS repeat-associated core domain protein n=1 Tax=Halobacteroides halobius (strain ATCC 35273 / DSM 5150 / MD-1) TaxID=748449 RepID=L0KAL1_HALHC|nr:DNRLRE domain-containing protein [Halobacteroides halobius]AGB41138.1 RHS repeat-associated core domain protein [Halobacteroides halobius DSM 5150]